MNQWIILLIAICSEVIATTSLKLSDGFSKLGPSVLVVLGYGISFYCLSLTLRSIPVGVVYAIWSGMGISLITLVGWHFFGEKLNIPTLVGISLIFAGIMVINFYSSVEA
ncbi:DMT family transporter [Tolumonas osonensis]|uniref:Small multidrug resistance pump n=1 Tax=Tolumonas osonensis TaxID=675874 RepID=A0A841GDJ9_9GAMM|nr:multidrug efflux SMR transporter [Tolumonas osonensis]MBB6054686.1 small multidrug resistance pump [Tolumonas osonensis]